MNFAPSTTLDVFPPTAVASDDGNREHSAKSKKRYRGRKKNNARGGKTAPAPKARLVARNDSKSMVSAPFVSSSGQHSGKKNTTRAAKTRTRATGASEDLICTATKKNGRKRREKKRQRHASEDGVHAEETSMDFEYDTIDETTAERHRAKPQKKRRRTKTPAKDRMLPEERAYLQSTHALPL